MSAAPILIVDDNRELRDALVEAMATAEQPVLVAESGAAALEILQQEAVGIVVTDWQMEPVDGLSLLRTIRSDFPVIPTIMMTGHGSIDGAVTAMQNGAADYLVKPFAAQDLRVLVRKYLRHNIATDELVAVDPATVALLATAARVAATDVTVTLSGPSGSGKEIFARYLHAQSKRCDKPFVALNCAAIPETMLEAMLFGYEKGAFTGAGNTHEGKFEQANGGTLLLDEVSEMDLGLQAKLLRVIQEKEVERLGASKSISLDTRLLATTNRDLKKYVADGRFREDLYYRLNVFPLHIPSLSERPGDILPLAEKIIREHSVGDIRLSGDAEQALQRHDWPGNVRELENVLQRALILLNSNCIEVADLGFEGLQDAPAESADLSKGVENHTFQLIVDAMRKFAGKRAEVATALGISPRTLRYKLARMRELDIAIPGESQ